MEEAATVHVAVVAKSVAQALFDCLLQVQAQCMMSRALRIALCRHHFHSMHRALLAERVWS